MSPLRHFRLLTVAGLASVAVFVIGQVGAFAYVSGTTGYDISYPQCGTVYPTGSFGVIGVDGGWPFISALHPGNPCLATEYAQASRPALYINTGYDRIYTDSDHTTSACLSQSAAIAGTTAQKRAWAVGCSEASKSMAYATAQGATTPGAYWLDVETGNSWSSRNLSLNQYTLQGIVDTLHTSLSVPVGVYSTAYQWRTIVGALPVTGLSADWVATGLSSSDSARAFCGTGFSGAPVWLAQYVSSGIDWDYAC